MVVKRKKAGRTSYPFAFKQKVIETAARERLTAPQVKKRFGVDAPTFYRWKGALDARRAPTAAPTNGSLELARALENSMRTQCQRVLLEMLRTQNR